MNRVNGFTPASSLQPTQAVGLEASRADREQKGADIREFCEVEENVG